MKKTLALLLTLVLAIGLMAPTAFAADPPDEAESKSGIGIVGDGYEIDDDDDDDWKDFKNTGLDFGEQDLRDVLGSAKTYDSMTQSRYTGPDPTPDMRTTGVIIKSMESDSKWRVTMALDYFIEEVTQNQSMPNATLKLGYIKHKDGEGAAASSYALPEKFNQEPTETHKIIWADAGFGQWGYEFEGFLTVPANGVKEKGESKAKMLYQVGPDVTP